MCRRRASLGLQCGTLLVPCHSEVDAGVAASAAVADKIGEKRKNEVDDGSMAKRHRNWLDRGKPGTVVGSWRPRAVHRAAAKKWVASLDAQFRTMAWHAGVSLFQ